MYARLWWKDTRQFWPIWLVLILAASATQWMLLAFIGRPARFGGLGLSALVWASLYAIAVGAAAFAGEREAGTLNLLDHLAADRLVVWVGKTSFALVTTLALSLLFLVMAAVSTERWNPPQYPLTPSHAACLCMIIPMALGWGLFWSSVLKTALGAAMAAIPCIGATFIIVSRGIDAILQGEPYGAASLGLAEVAMVIVTAAASEAFFTGGVRLKRLNVQFRSPIVLTRTPSPASRQIQIQSPIQATVPISSSPRPITVARVLEAGNPTPVSRRTWLIEARILALQTVKETWQTWLLLTGIAIVLPALAYYSGRRYVDPLWLTILSMVAFLMSGVSVFGLENRARTYRFLVHHGARPGLVWMVKLATWILGLSTITLSVGCGWILMLYSFGPPFERWGSAVLALPLVFAVAVICGMTCRRGITAFVLALVLSLCLMFPLLFLVFMDLLPGQGLVLVAAALLTISWAWRGDWILERPAPGRWLRLGLFLSIAVALLSACYIGFRVWSVPDVGPISPPAAWNDAPTSLSSPDRNAADLYREAGLRLVQNANSQESRSRDQEALDLIRRATARPDCLFAQPNKQTLINPAALPPLLQIEEVVSREARARLERGDLAGCWDDIMLLFRMARQFCEGSGVQPAHLALKSVERDALILAIDWAMARGQTSERLHAALASYLNLPKMPNPTEIVRAEANIVENTLDLPARTFRDWLMQSLLDGNQVQGAGQLYAFASTSLIAAPWERARARRVNRLLSAAAIQFATREPGQRPDQTLPGLDDQDVEHAWRSTPRLMMTLFGNVYPYIKSDDLHEVGRRALELIVALRAWQLKHGGRLPDDLGALVPEEIATLPKDPYSNGSFGYVRWNGQQVLTLRSVLVERPSFQDFLNGPPPPGSRILYSVGPDRRDDHGAASTALSQASDIGFVIPAIDATVPSEKDDKTQGSPKDKPAPTAPK